MASKRELRRRCYQKRAYEEREQADNVVGRMNAQYPGETFNAYLCRCLFFHVGHKRGSGRVIGLPAPAKAT